jgi:predicted phosphodiesterase
MASRRVDEAYIAEIQLTVDLYKRCHSMKEVAKQLKINISTISRRLDMAHKYGINADTDREIVVETVKLAKQKQGLQDVQRIERKSFRENARIENAVEALNIEIVEILNATKFDAPKAKASKIKGKACLILHISDNHLNEQVDLPHNQFNWIIAGQRLKKLADRTIQIGKAYGIKNLLIAFTGDLLNSDRRLDEMLSNATNRASACILAVYLYGQMLQHLAGNFQVSVASISGNESRIQKDVGWAKEVASDNYDALIFNILRMQHGHYIDFSHSTEPSEQVILVAGQNVLLIHGHGAKGTGQINIQAVKGKYLARGIVIDFVISGHYHEAHIADYYARSSSLVGSNHYSEDALNMAGRASQNLYIVHEGGGFDGLKVDLQHTDDIECYDIKEHLITYNTKSASKCHQSQTIFSVVI